MRLANYLDADGMPICTVCGKPIGPVDATAKIEDCLIHLSCFREARQRALSGEEPCEPAP